MSGSLSLGQVMTGKNGGVQISQKVLGIDVKEITDKLVEGKTKQNEPIQDAIKLSDKKIVALDEAKTKLLNIKGQAIQMASKLFLYQSDKAPSVFDRRAVQMTSSDGTPSDLIARISANNEANLGSFKVVVNQTASGDILRSTISTNDLSANFGVAGTLNLGTVIPGASQAISITADMSLNEILDAINEQSIKTGVSAELAFVGPGQYEFKLKAAQTGAAIVMDGSSVLSALNLTPVAQSSLCGALQSVSHQTALGITGSLTVGINGGMSTQVITINPTDTLHNIQQAIVAASGTTGITADFDLLQNETTSGGAKTYQLRLRCTNPANTVYVADTGGAIAALGLNKPVTDYNTICAKVTCDGTAFKRNGNAINDILSGVTMDLQNAAPGTTLTGTISKDIKLFMATLDEFITTYNAFQTFYDEQNKMEELPDGKKVAGKEAYLYKNQLLEQCKTELSLILSAPTPGLNPTGAVTYTPDSLMSMGLTIDQKTKFLKMDDETKFNDFLKPEKFAAVQKILGMNAESSNTLFRVGPPGSLLSAEASNAPITVHYAKAMDGTLSASFTLNGVSYDATIKNGIIRAKDEMIDGGGHPVASPVAGLCVTYDAELVNGASDSSTITMTQGVCARLDLALQKLTLSESINEAGVRIPGPFGTEVKKIQEEKREKQQTIDKKMDQISKESNHMAKQFDSVYKAMAQYDEIHNMIKSFNKANK